MEKQGLSEAASPFCAPVSSEIPSNWPVLEPKWPVQGLQGHCSVRDFRPDTAVLGSSHRNFSGESAAGSEGANSMHVKKEVVLRNGAGGQRGPLQFVISHHLTSRKRRKFKNAFFGTSLVIQWFSFSTSIAGGAGSIPGWGTKIPHAVWCSQKIKNKTESHSLKKN